MESVIWKPVRGYEDRYIVSSNGEVMSLDSGTHKGRKKQFRANNRGYICVAICENGRTKTRLVHRLVAEAFIPNPHNKNQVNHIDGNKENNCVSNLEWVTDNENKSHSSIFSGGTQRPKRSVVVTNISTGEISVFEGLREAERCLHLDHGSVMRMIKGQVNKHRGYTIAYAKGGEA